MTTEQEIMQQAADAGRATDKILAHLTPGETVIPREMMEDEEVAQVVQSLFQAYGIDMGEFVVGDEMNKINPETGYPEFFFGKIFKGIKRVFKKIAPIALPILGSLIPGVGPIAGAALGGAAGGLVSGGGLKAALTGAGLGALGGAMTGGAGGILGHAAGTSADVVKGIAGLQGPAIGSGIKGALSGGGLAALGSGASTGGLGNLSSFVRPASSFIMAGKEDDNAEKARRALLEATGRAERAINPYSRLGVGAQEQLAGNLEQGFNPGDLSSDPGYQFRLQQGLDAQQRQLLASGMSQSGAALKAAQEYGQGFAAQEYGNAYDRWLAQNQQLAGVGNTGFGAANALTGIYGATGNVNAMALQSEMERKNKRINEILTGLGY